MSHAKCTDAGALAEKYRAAAYMIEGGEYFYACNALEAAGLTCSPFSAMFRPTLKEINEYVPLPSGERWYATDIGGAWGFFLDEGTPGGRALALRFMAAMAEDGYVR
jgi:hypothetical protein